MAEAGRIGLYGAEIRAEQGQIGEVVQFGPAGAATGLQPGSFAGTAERIGLVGSAIRVVAGIAGLPGGPNMSAATVLQSGRLTLRLQWDISRIAKKSYGDLHPFAKPVYSIADMVRIAERQAKMVQLTAMREGRMLPPRKVYTPPKPGR